MHANLTKLCFIGRVEDFEADFKEFLTRMEVDRVRLVNENKVGLQGGRSD